jgi:hypothetical protein
MLDEKGRMTFANHPTICLGSNQSQELLGAKWNDQVLHNSLESFNNDSAEQDIVFQRNKNGSLYGYRETVVRFNWKSKEKIFTQIAVVDYTPDRHCRKITVMQGDIVPDWQPAANEVSQICGEPWETIEKEFDL